MAPTALPTTIAHPPFVLFVYFPSHHSLNLLLPFFLSLLVLVQSLPLSSPCLFSLLLIFSNSSIVFQLPLIFSYFSVFLSFLVFFPFTLLLITYFLHLSRFLHSSSFLYSSSFLFSSFCFLLLLLPFTLNFFVFFTPLFLFVPCSTGYISFHSSVLFFSLDCILFPFYPHLSRLPCFLLLFSFPLHITSFSATAKRPSS